MSRDPVVLAEIENDTEQGYSPGFELRMREKMQREYNQGVDDCKNNRIPNDSLGEAYCEGYADQYAKEQQQSKGGFN